jgi:hypothetical protein
MLNAFLQLGTRLNQVRLHQYSALLISIFSISRSEIPLPPTSPYWVSPSTANLEKKLREDGMKNEMMEKLGDDTASLDRKKVNCV